MRAFALLSCAMVLFLSGAAAAQTEAEPSLLYQNPEQRFAVIFPAAPMMREIRYMTKDGAAVPARQYYVEQGQDEFVVTVVPLPAGPAIDNAALEHAADRLRERGEVRFQYDMGYDPGIPGRQLNIFLPDGRQLRSSIYMWDHHLVIAQATAAPGSAPALQFEQSIMLLNPDGSEVDTGQGNAPVRAP